MILDQLDQEGYISHLKAQIKSRVYKTIEGQSKTVKQNLEFDYLTPFQRQNKSKEVMLAVHLMRDFLKFYEMEYTFPVFENETNVHENIAKETLLKDLDLVRKAEDDNKPLLVHVIAALLEQNEKLKAEKAAPKVSKSPQTDKKVTSPIDEFDYSVEKGSRQRDNNLLGMDLAQSTKKKLAPLDKPSNSHEDQPSPKLADKFNTHSLACHEPQHDHSLSVSFEKPKDDEVEEEINVEDVEAQEREDEGNRKGGSTTQVASTSQTLGYDNSVTSYHLDFNDYVEDIETVK